jgi:hypothetical protein
MRGKQAQRVAQERLAAEGAKLLWRAISGPRALSGRHNDCRNLHFISKTAGLGFFRGFLNRIFRSTTSRNSL